MKLVVVSSNPLFTEVLDAALQEHNHYEMTVAMPCEFAQVLAKVEPDVIIVDESLSQAVYEPLLTVAREMTSSRIILLNPMNNRLCVLDSRRAIIQETNDLCQAIGRQTAGASSETSQRKKARGGAIKEVKKRQN
jgi:DNA-binding NarL/FixJ family response regulator